MPPHVSFNFITRNAPQALVKCIQSLGSVYRPGDEIVIVDTGSTEEQLGELRGYLEALQEDFEIILAPRPELARDWGPKLREWLPECEKEFIEARGDAIFVDSFAAARNVALSLSTHPIVAWLDSDDILTEEFPGRLREIVDSGMDPDAPRIDAILLGYNYGFDPDGTCTTYLKRERFFFKDRYRWVGRCHETAIPAPGISPPPREVGFFADAGAVVVHTEARSPHRLSDIRNYLLLRADMEEAQARGENVDPRTLLYLANASRGLNRFQEAHKLYDVFNTLSGSRDDRFNALYYRAAMYLDPKVGRPFDALDCYLEAHKVNPGDARGHFGLSRCYAALHRYPEALSWYRFGCSIPFELQNQIYSVDPTHLNYHSHLIASNVSAEAGDVDNAMQLAAKALQARPEFAEAKENFERIRWRAASRKISEGVMTYLQSMKNRGPNAAEVGRRLCREWDVVPIELEDQGISKIEPPDSRDPKPDVAIWTGYCPEEWSWRSADTGIGGSEKMVILLADALQASGKCNVSVYTRVPYPLRGLSPAGVMWRHFAEFDHKRPRHALVAWRNPGAVCSPVPAKKRIVWCHDVQSVAQYSEEILACVDKINLQSEYHAQPFRADARFNGKLWVARNALVPPDRAVEYGPRNPKQVVFFSSPDRGILTATEIVGRAQQIDPEIKFVVCYGVAPWARKAFAANNHRQIPDVNHECSTDDYERRWRGALDVVNARVLNRVGFAELEELLATSGVWLYPTRFHEISCMAAMESQAYGLVPVATRHAALAETILPEGDALAGGSIPVTYKLGVGGPMVDEGTELLLNAVNVPANDPLREALADAAVARFNIADLAQDWLRELSL